MAVKISNSGINQWTTCPKSYEIKYINKIHPKYRGSALFFGSAIDATLNFVLAEYKKINDNAKLIDAAIKIFDTQWEQQEDRYFGTIDLPKNEFILYSKYDFDVDMLEKSDWSELYALSDEPIEKFNHIADTLKHTDFSELSSENRMFYNFCNWLALKRKARHMIHAYVADLLPNIEEVLEVQMNLDTEDDSGNKLTGVADFVCKLKPGVYGKVTLMEAETVIPDNKTSSMDYDEDSVETSAQLTKYKVILNEKHGYNITKGAYFVIGKKFKKEKTKTCKSCGHISSGSHKTCDAMLGGVKRCGGEWNIVTRIIVPTQIIVQEIPEIFTNIVMENVDAIVKVIAAGAFPRNFNACSNQFGKPCQYFNYCHKNSMQDLVQVKDKKG